MPINLQWRPSSGPPTTDTPDNIGLDIGGDDAAVAAVTPGRIRLIEVPDLSGTASAGPNEDATERLLATFHGNFTNILSNPLPTRLGFQIFINGTAPAHDGKVHGFDPECMFGVDAFIFTMVNRRFVVWFPFYIDTRTEGRFVEIRAVAEVFTGAAGTAIRELGRSALLNLGIRRKRSVASTSLVNSVPIRYTANLVGNAVLAHEEFLMPVQLPPPVGAAATVPGFVAVPTAGGGAIRFAAYPANAMLIMLSRNLLGALKPLSSQLQSRVTNLPDPLGAENRARARYKQQVAAAITTIMLDAGFTGARVLWQDEDPPAAAFNAQFTAAFALRQNRWSLINPAIPFATGFWNFVVTHDDSVGGGVGEQLQFELQTRRDVAGTNAFIAHEIPVGGGNKRLTQTIRINGALMLDRLLNSGGTARRFADEAALVAAIDRSSDHVAMIVAHEVGHSLGLMHTPHVESGDFSEANGSPVLTVMSEGVDGGGFGTNMRFSAQAKIIFAEAFRVTPTFPDPSLRNKTWRADEVRTVGWSQRTSRFIERHGETGMREPLFAGSPSGVPPFAGVPPRSQKGTR